MRIPPTPRSIPITCRDNAATGFLVRDDSRMWLVTCVHLVSGLRKTPLEDALFTSAAIAIPGSTTVLALFREGGQRFSVVRNTTDGFLVDALAVLLTADEAEALASYGSYERRGIIPVAVGDSVTAFGFPGIGSMLPARVPVTAETLTAQVEAVEGLSNRLSSASVKGMSGGPVTHGGKLVGIMHGDVGASAAMTNGLVISLAVVGDALFV